MKRSLNNLKSAIRNPQSEIALNQSGIALITALLIMVLLTLLGTAAIMTTSTDVQIGANFKRIQDVFYVSDAGLQAGADFLGQNFDPDTGWSGYLTNGNNNVDASGYTYPGVTPPTTIKGTNISASLTAAHGAGSFQVSVLDDETTATDEDGDWTIDTNKRVVVTSKGAFTMGSATVYKTVEQMIEFYQSYTTYGGKDITVGGTNVAAGETSWN